MTWELDICSLPHSAALPSPLLTAWLVFKVMIRSVGGSWGICGQDWCSLLRGTSGETQEPQGSLEQRQLLHGQKEDANANSASKGSCASPGAAPRDVCVSLSQPHSRAQPGCYWGLPCPGRKSQLVQIGIFLSQEWHPGKQTTTHGQQCSPGR